MNDEIEDQITQRVGKIITRIAVESERSAVILGLAIIDTLLEEYLKSIFINQSNGADNLFDPERPLSTLSAKTTLAYRLGAISLEFESTLKHLRKIRNEFAHNVETESLSEQKHKDRIKEMMKLVKKDVLFSYIYRDLRKQIPTAELVEFCTIVTIVCINLELGKIESGKYNTGWCIDFKVGDMPA